MNSTQAYQLAQNSLASLKTSIHILLTENSDGLTNAQIGRALGIYYGHSGKHVGHIPRVLLEIMKGEGIVEQNSRNKKWIIRQLSI
jgi:hypothetical protein